MKLTLTRKIKSSFLKKEKAILWIFMIAPVNLLLILKIIQSSLELLYLARELNNSHVNNSVKIIS